LQFNTLIKKREIHNEKTGALEGIAYDMMNELAKRMGTKATI